MGARTSTPSLAVAVESCCSPLTGGALGAVPAQRLARIFKALGDPTRVRLLSLIAATEGGEACICDLTGPVQLSQPTVSHHMRVLTEAGLITREQRGKWAYYAVVGEALDALSSALASRPPDIRSRRHADRGSG
ncbi:MAG: ArsR/SmtB family transcription factor [Mycobacteriales bacterium]